MKAKNLAICAAVVALCILSTLESDARNYKDVFAGQKYYEPVVVNEPTGIFPGISNWLDFQTAVINLYIRQQIAKSNAAKSKDVDAQKESGQMIQLRTLYTQKATKER